MTEHARDILEKIKGTAWSFFIDKRPVAWLAIIGIVVSGIISLSALPREIQPEVKIPFVSVTTALPGASPEDTESLISIPLEEKIANIEDIETLSSSSGFGYSSVFIEFNAKADMDEVLQKVKDAVDLVKPELPDDATDPQVVKAEANSFSIITFSVTGDIPIPDLTYIAEDIQDELEQVKGVSNVVVSGGQKKYIKITLDQEKVEGYGLDIQTISNLIKFANNNLPIGIVTSDQLNYSIRIDNRYESINDIRELPLIAIGQNEKTPILLKDISTIEEAYPVQTILSKHSEKGTKSSSSITLQVFKKEDTNILDIADKSREKIEELKENNKIPKEVQVEVSNDNSVFIRKELGTLTQNGITTTLLIVFILFLALGFTQGIIAGLSIPIVFLITFTILNQMGMTLNTLSLFSMVIALGLMVDTSIVIMEGIHENIKKGRSTKEAALISIQTYKWPLVAGTMTTVFAFFPMLLVSGILGEFLKTLPITISATLLGSLFVALTLSPSITAGLLKAGKKRSKKSILEPLFEKLGAKFHDWIEYIIQKRSIRVITILISLIAFGFSLSLPITGALKVEMFPKTDQPYFTIQIETPKGSVIDKTLDITNQVEETLYNIPEIKNFVTKIGTSTSVGLSDDPFSQSGTSDSNLSNLTINLVDESERERLSYEIADEIRKKVAPIQGAKIKVVEFKEGPPSEGAIALRITGDDLDILTDLGNQVKAIAEKTPGTKNIEISLKPGLNEFKFTLDKDRLASYGLSSIQVSSLIRSIIQGQEATEVTFKGEDLNVYVSYDLNKENNRTNISIHDIENFEIATPSGQTVSLSEIGKYDFGQSLSSISREDETRIIKITGDTEINANVVDVNSTIQKGIDNMEIPPGYNIQFGGDLEDIAESFQDLFRSMFVAIILIAFTLVLMFNSFRQPLIILFTLPLALIGVFPGLSLIGQNLSFPAFLGVVALTGIVVNDAIVLIDRINKNREQNMSLTTSIAEASNARLQPILMTSITTIVGIFPLALTNEFWSGLGFALIFGLMASTILTLVVVPVLYYIVEGKKAKKLAQNT